MTTNTAEFDVTLSLVDAESGGGEETTTGTLKGSVAKEGGQIIEGATVEVTADGGSYNDTKETGSFGLVSFPEVPVASYTVTISADYPDSDSQTYETVTVNISESDFGGSVVTN